MLIVTGYVVGAPQTIDEMLRISLEHVRRSRTEPGCISHGVHTDRENSLRLQFFERWSDAEALRAHFGMPESRAFARRLRELAAEQGEMVVYDAQKVRI